jgi:multiple sugar transport system permease protein
MSNQVINSTSQVAVGSQPRVLGWNKSSRDTIQAYLFLVPFLIIYVVFVIYPVIQAAYMSLFKWDLLAPHLNKFIGLDNYTTMLGGSGLTWNINHLFIWRLLGLAAVALVIGCHPRLDEKEFRHLVKRGAGRHFWCSAGPQCPRRGRTAE